MPSASACCCDTSGVQRLSYLPKCGRACFLCFADDGKNVGRIAISFSLDDTNGALAGHVEPWVAKGDTTRLCGCECLPCARGDEAQLFLCDGGEEMKDEGVNIRPQL